MRRVWPSWAREEASRVKGRGWWTTIAMRGRAMTLGLTLISQLVTAVGVPVPLPTRTKPNAGVPFPCQNRPCGCLTSEQCWAGDCCCFSYEEKLRWAEANGVVPPAPVRRDGETPTVRRKALRARCSCSAEEGTAEPTVSDRPKGDATPTKAGTNECCRHELDGEKTRTATSPCCGSEVKRQGCEPEEVAEAAGESATRWWIVIFAHRCRGDGPMGWLQLEPAIVLGFSGAMLLENDQSNERVLLTSDRGSSLTRSPDTPPPRIVFTASTN